MVCSVLGPCGAIQAHMANYVSCGEREPRIQIQPQVFPDSEYAAPTRQTFRTQCVSNGFGRYRYETAWKSNQGA